MTTPLRPVPGHRTRRSRPCIAGLCRACTERTPRCRCPAAFSRVQCGCIYLEDRRPEPDLFFKKQPWQGRVASKRMCTLAFDALSEVCRLVNIEALCAAPPEALPHSPSQMPLSCQVAPPPEVDKGIPGVQLHAQHDRASVKAPPAAQRCLQISFAENAPRYLRSPSTALLPGIRAFASHLPPDAPRSPWESHSHGPPSSASHLPPDWRDAVSSGVSLARASLIRFTACSRHGAVSKPSFCWNGRGAAPGVHCSSWVSGVRPCPVVSWRFPS